MFFAESGRYPFLSQVVERADLILIDRLEEKSWKLKGVLICVFGSVAMEKNKLDFVLVPLGLVIMVVYHLWLFSSIIRKPKRTVVGLNALARKRWVKYMMSDPLKNGVLAVQTIRNSIMASTLLATTAITLSSLIGVVVSITRDGSNSASALIYGNDSPLVGSIKLFTILVCFLVAFLCNVQSIRYYAHISFLITVSPPNDVKSSLDYVARSLNRGANCWSLGLRSIYFSIPLFLWIFGPIPMLVSSAILTCALYFLDTTSAFTQNLHYFLELEDDDGRMKTVDKIGFSPP